MNQQSTSLLSNVQFAIDQVTALTSYDDVFDYMNNDVLEVITHTATSMSSPTVHTYSYELLLACGGPTIRLYTKDNSIQGTWGGDTPVTQYYNSDVLNDALEELYEPHNCDE